MRHTHWIWLVGLLFCGGLSPSQSEAADLLKPLKIAIIVGNNKGMSSEKTLRYAISDAKKVYRTLRDLGSYQTSDMYIMVGRKAAEVKQTLQQVKARLKQVKRRTPNRSTMLLFYYSGHADGKTLHLGSTKLGFPWLRKWMKHNPAQVRLAILDTCRSGQIIRTKGARRVSKEVPLPPVIRNATTRGMALITSSGVREDSHELDQLRSSVFTHYLVSGLRGAADKDRDGHVTLREAYSYAYQRTISHTVFLSSGIQHPSFRNELHGHGHLILTKPKRASSRLLFEARLEGTYFILNKRRNKLLAELHKERGKAMQLGLGAGEYTVVRRSSRSYQVQMVQLRKGQQHKLQGGNMMALSYAWSASKGMKWLTHDLRSTYQYPSPYRKGFHAAIGVGAAGILGAAVGFGLVAANQAQAHKELYGDGNTPPIGYVRQETTDAVNASYTGAFVGLGLIGLATGAAIFFYVMHDKHIRAKQNTLAQRKHKRTNQHATLPPHPQAKRFTFVTH